MTLSRLNFPRLTGVSGQALLLLSCVLQPLTLEATRRASGMCSGFAPWQLFRAIELQSTPLVESINCCHGELACTEVVMSTRNVLQSHVELYSTAIRPKETTAASPLSVPALQRFLNVLHGKNADCCAEQQLQCTCRPEWPFKIPNYCFLENKEKSGQMSKHTHTQHNRLRTLMLP